LTFLYDTIKGLVTGVISPNGDSLSYQYDGTLPMNVNWTGSVNGNIKVRYNNDMKVLAETINNKDSVNFVYDKDGLLTNAGALKLKSSTANNLLLSDTLGTVVTNYTYTSFGEIASQQSLFGSTVLYQVNYTRDSLGRISEKTETIQGVATKYDYVYDVKGQLMQVSKNDTIISTYTYDANGNRLTHITPTQADSGVYDEQDRLIHYSSSQYLYSTNGDLQKKIQGSDTTRYDYDAMGNLLSVILPNGSRIEYVADGAGRRIIRKTDGQITNRWLYSDELRISGEVDSVGNVVSHFVYATKQNMPDYIAKGGITYRVLTDQLGSVRQVINSVTGEVVQRMDYDEFGNVINSIGLQIVPMGFAGGIYDQQTGLTRFGARDYDAKIGRWTIKDPLLFGSGLTNHYLYTSNNPINLIDYNGGVSESAGNSGPFGVPDVKINMGQAVAAATIFAAATNLINTVVAIGMEGEISAKEIASLGLDMFAISAATYNYAAFSQSEFANASETDPIGYLAKELGFSKQGVALGAAITAGVTVALTAKAFPSISVLAKTMNVTMAVYAFGKATWIPAWMP
jgi:RHS repeat-associated protein